LQQNASLDFFKKLLCGGKLRILYRLLISSLFIIIWSGFSEAESQLKNYEDILWNYLKKVYSFGPRYSGSVGNQKLQNFLLEEGNSLADSIFVQGFFHRPKGGFPIPMANIQFRFEGKKKTSNPFF